jgi:hypothetical protein
VDQLPQKKIAANRLKSSGSRSYKCQSEEQDMNIDEFNSAEEQNMLDHMKSSLLSDSIHTNQGRHFVNQKALKESVFPSASLAEITKIEKVAQEQTVKKELPKKMGKNTAVVNLNSMHERLKSSFIASNVPKEDIEDELLVRSPEHNTRAVDRKQAQIISGETKLQKAQTKTLQKQQKKKSNNFPSSKPNPLTSSYSSTQNPHHHQTP